MDFNNYKIMMSDNLLMIKLTFRFLVLVYLLSKRWKLLSVLRWESEGWNILTLEWPILASKTKEGSNVRCDRKELW